MSNRAYLAPDTQVTELGLEAVDGGEPMTERPLCLVLGKVNGGERMGFGETLLVVAARKGFGRIGRFWGPHAESVKNLT